MFKQQFITLFLQDNFALKKKFLGHAIVSQLCEGHPQVKLFSMSNVFSSFNLKSYKSSSRKWQKSKVQHLSALPLLTRLLITVTNFSVWAAVISELSCSLLRHLLLMNISTTSHLNVMLCLFFFFFFTSLRQCKNSLEFMRRNWQYPYTVLYTESFWKKF